MARQRRKTITKLSFPITVRQAQILLKREWRDGIMEYAYQKGIASAQSQLKKILDKLASIDPNQVFLDESGELAELENSAKEPEYAPKETDEVALSSGQSDDATLHGGDNASQEVKDGQSQGGDKGSQKGIAQSQATGTDEGSHGQGSGKPQKSESCDSDSSQSQLPRDEEPTSGSSEQDESSENPAPQKRDVGSTALPKMSEPEAKKDAPPNKEATPRDAEASNQPQTGSPEDNSVSLGIEEEIPQETDQEQNRQQSIADNSDDCQPNSEADQLRDDRPSHQKKWGKSFSKAEKAKLSLDANSNHGGATASLSGIGVDAKLLKLCRQRLAALVGDSSQDYSPRRDYQEFCARLKTFRNPNPARKEESGRPCILIMADVSGSCSGFSEQSVAVAKAASALGVQGADILVLSHSNGYPYELEHNGKSVDILKVGTMAGYEHAHNNGIWYDALMAKYQIEVAIALGDWDAADDYARVASHPGVRHFIWLDNAHCSSRGTVCDRTKFALKNLEQQGIKTLNLLHKLIYRDGCKDAIAFISQIKV